MHPSVYKRPLLGVLAVLIIGLVLFYVSAPSVRDVSRLLHQKEVTLTARVESFPVAKSGKQTAILRVLEADGQPARGRVYARFSGFTPQWKDILRVQGTWQTPYGTDIPGNFNWKNYLAQKQIFAEIKSDRAVVQQPAGVVWRGVRALRRDMLRVLDSSFPAPLAAIAGGILLGERGEVPADLYTAFQDSGAIHLLVASGGNVGFVTLLTLGLGMWLGLRRRALLLVALGTAGIYTFVAGADAPLLRAYLMAVCACVGYFFGRNSGVFQGLILSCLLILGFTPSAVFDTGFQMSFLATLAIVIILNNYRIPGKWPPLLRFFAQIFLATLASQLVLLPIFTNVFYKVSLTGLLSNMILVPFASFLMGLGFAYYVFSVLHIGAVLYYPCLWGLMGFEKLVEFFAAFRFSALAVTAWNGGSVAAYYILLFWASQLPHEAFARRIALPCMAAAVLAFGGGWALSNRPKAYLFGEWNNRAAVVRLNRKSAVVFNGGLSAAKLQRALYALGFSDAEFVGALHADEPGAPALWTHIWPGDTFAVSGGRVQAVWELRQAQDGRIWQDAGYDGRRGKGLSYCVQTKKREICVGGQGRFLQLPGGKILPAELNRTVSAFW